MLPVLGGCSKQVRRKGQQLDRGRRGRDSPSEGVGFALGSEGQVGKKNGRNAVLPTRGQGSGRAAGGGLVCPSALGRGPGRRAGASSWKASEARPSPRVCAGRTGAGGPAGRGQDCGALSDQRGSWDAMRTGAVPSQGGRPHPGLCAPCDSDCARVLAAGPSPGVMLWADTLPDTRRAWPLPRALSPSSFRLLASPPFCLL